MELFWIVLGICYVVYRLIKESRFFNTIGTPEMKPQVQKSFDRQKELSLLSNKQIGELIGVSYESIPSNEKIINSQGLLLYGYSHTIKRRCVETYILNSEGLDWYKFYSQGYGKYNIIKDVPLDPEYNKKVVNFIDQKLALKKSVKDKLFKAGHELDDSIIDLIVFSTSSPVNTMYIDLPAEDLYKWVCEAKSLEMKRASADSLGEKLGIPLNEIPLNKSPSDIDAVVERMIYAEIRILKDQNIEYVPYYNWLKIDKDSEYFIFFNNFVDEYLSKHKY